MNAVSTLRLVPAQLLVLVTGRMRRLGCER